HRGLPQHCVLHALYRLRATCDRNLSRGGSHLHHADLGRIAGLSGPQRAVQSLAWHFAPAGCPWIGRADLSADRIERLDRPCSLARTQCTPIGDGSDRTMTSPTIGSADLRDTCPELARGDKSKKALRIDIHLEPDSAFALGRGGNPSAQIS